MSTCHDESLTDIDSIKTYDRRVIFIDDIVFDNEISEFESIGETNDLRYKHIGCVNRIHDSVAQNNCARTE